MKKNIIVAGLILLLASCSDFLEEVPRDRLGEGNFYKTLEDARSAVNAIYNPIRVGAFQGPYFLQVEIMADYADGRGSTAPIGQYQGLDLTNIQRVGGIWNGFYRSIRNANIAINAIPGIESIAETQRDALVAEARFMRAFVYFHLVRHWGAVPLYLGEEGESSARKPEDEIYAAIIADLAYGEEYLPAVPAEYGRPTKWAATSLLSYVHLTREEWELARDKAEAVINSGAFSLVTVTQLDDWDKIFGPSANGTSEEIFYLKFNHIVGWEWPHNLLWEETLFSPFGNAVIYSTPDNKFLNAWDDNDLRKQWDVFSEYINRNTGEWTSLPELAPVLFSKWRDPGATALNAHGNDYPFMRLADVMLIYAEAACMANGNPTPQAVEYLNKIKRRGYGYPADAASPVDYPSSGWTAETFQDAVLQERAYELFMEGKRWLDLKRTGKIKEVIKANLGMDVADVHFYWPIPQQEIDTNPEINPEDQNPGYN